MKGRGQLAVGSRVSGTPYRVERLIGSGGMGNVYEVEHEELGRRFVLKILHETLSDRTDVVARMRNEWRVLAGLRHPHIVQVTDAGHSREGRPFYVMERLDGETVAALVARRGRVPVVEAGRIIVDVLEGLSAAHAAGAIHRDIKPQNVFVAADGCAKLLDFGIAKIRDRASEVVTVAGKTIGTPRFMAPEQAEGRAVDGRADIYSCALVFYEMLAGRGPFAHVRDPNELVLAHIGQEPERLDWITSNVNSEVADLVHRWLSKRPSSRPPNAAAARDELRALLLTFPRESPSPSADVTLGGALYDAVTVGPSRSTSVTSVTAASVDEGEGPRPEALGTPRRASEMTPSSARESHHETLTHDVEPHAPRRARSAPSALASAWNEPVPSEPFPARLRDVHGASSGFSSAGAARRGAVLSAENERWRRLETSDPLEEDGHRPALQGVTTPPPVTTSSDVASLAEAGPLGASASSGELATSGPPSRFLRWMGPTQRAFLVALGGSFAMALVWARGEWIRRDAPHEGDVRHEERTPHDATTSGRAHEPVANTLEGRSVIDVDRTPERASASDVAVPPSSRPDAVLPSDVLPSDLSPSDVSPSDVSPSDAPPSAAGVPRSGAVTHPAGAPGEKKSAPESESTPPRAAARSAPDLLPGRKTSKKTSASPTSPGLPDSGL